MKQITMDNLDWVRKLPESNRWKKIYEDAIKADPNKDKEETRLIEARFRGFGEGIHVTVKIMHQHLKQG